MDANIVAIIVIILVVKEPKMCLTLFLCQAYATMTPAVPGDANEGHFLAGGVVDQ